MSVNRHLLTHASRRILKNFIQCTMLLQQPYDVLVKVLVLSPRWQSFQQLTTSLVPAGLYSTSPTRRTNPVLGPCMYRHMLAIGRSAGCVGPRPAAAAKAPIRGTHACAVHVGARSLAEPSTSYSKGEPFPLRAREVAVWWLDPSSVRYYGVPPIQSRTPRSRSPFRYHVTWHRMCWLLSSSAHPRGEHGVVQPYERLLLKHVTRSSHRQLSRAQALI